MMAESSSYHSGLYNMKLIYEHGGFGRLIYSEGEYYHYNVDRPWGYKEWRNALPPMWYPTHSTAYYIGVTRGRYTAVSCLGFRGKAERYANNAYHNPFSDETALFTTSEFIMSVIENRAPLVDVYEAIAMTAPGLVAHQSALKDGEQLKIPQFDPPKAAPEG